MESINIQNKSKIINNKNAKNNQKHPLGFVPLVGQQASANEIIVGGLIPFSPKLIGFNFETSFVDLI